MTENQRKAVAFIQANTKTRYNGDGSINDAADFIRANWQQANKARFAKQGVRMTKKQQGAIRFIHEFTGIAYKDGDDMQKARLFIMRHMGAAREASKDRDMGL